MTKKCYTCQIDKPREDFPKHNQKKDGLDPNCKQCRCDKAKISYLKHSEKIKNKSNNYYYANKKLFISKQIVYTKKRRKEDPFFALTLRLRNRLWYALQKTTWKKNTNFSKYIGCSKDELLIHIEMQFKNGMNWENRNLWDIDHIIPLSSAKNEEELYKLCHYKNLQPMWSKENRQKGSKI